jgi:hypothetical protein
VKSKYKKLVLGVLLALMVGVALTSGCTKKVQKKAEKEAPPTKTAKKESKPSLTPPAPQGFKTYTAKEGWSIAYPKNWFEYLPATSSAEPYLRDMLDVRPEEFGPVAVVVHPLRPEPDQSEHEYLDSKKDPWKNRDSQCKSSR